MKKIPWSEIADECYNKDLDFAYPHTKVIYTDDKTQRAAILQKPDMTYTIMYQILYPLTDDELMYSNNGLHGYWHPKALGMISIFDTVNSAEKAVLSEPPFKYNKETRIVTGLHISSPCDILLAR
ncbi:MAG: hypothetical protein FWD25_08835 [Clostridia bacterium]|nr:hypothetical protein [Clostridia bacterium]